MRVLRAGGHKQVDVFRHELGVREHPLLDDTHDRLVVERKVDLEAALFG